MICRSNGLRPDTAIDIDLPLPWRSCARLASTAHLISRILGAFKMEELECWTRVRQERRRRQIPVFLVEFAEGGYAWSDRSNARSRRKRRTKARLPTYANAHPAREIDEEGRNLVAFTARRKISIVTTLLANRAQGYPRLPSSVYRFPL